MIKVGRGALRAFDRTVWRKPLARCVGKYLWVFNGVSWWEKERQTSSAGKWTGRKSWFRV